jgi:hypothetical protein
VALVQRAYGAEDGLAYDEPSGTLAVAGTRLSMSDILADVAYMFGLEKLVPHSRFSAAEEAVARLHPRTVVGHSLGGAVAGTFTGRVPHTIGLDPWALPYRTQPDESYSDHLDPVSVMAEHNHRVAWGVPHRLKTLAGIRR